MRFLILCLVVVFMNSCNKAKIAFKAENEESLCGNGKLEPNETCDDGNTDSETCDYAGGDGAQACTFAECGDGYLNDTAGELCETTLDTDQCDFSEGTGAQACTPAEYGDDYINVAACELCACDAEDCVQTKLQASDAVANISFGQAVAINNNIIVVGDYGKDDNGAFAGAAYIFERDENNSVQWNETNKILASDGEAGDYFGNAVSISGNTIVIGAKLDGDNGDTSGSVWIFEKEADNAWTNMTSEKLTPLDGGPNDFFGEALSIDNDTIVVGASNDDDHGSNSGSAYVFSRNQDGTDAWEEVKKITASDAKEGDGFGSSIALSGDTAVIGAFWDDINGRRSGSAYVFYRNQDGTDAWGQVIKLVPSDPTPDSDFGYSVAISGDIIVIGAPAHPIEGVSGSAYVFYRNEGGADAWGEVKKLLPNNSDGYQSFGQTVSISKHTIVVSAFGNPENLSGSGSVYIFQHDADVVNEWSEMVQLGSSNSDQIDFYYGIAVDISGDTLVVGSSDNSGGSFGSIYVY